MAQRILVVDDQDRDRRLVEAMLDPFGYEIVTATSGDEALAVALSDPPDLILLDVVMPGMNGYDVCRRIRANERTQTLPIVMLTANADQDKVTALEIGADDFLAKPVDRREHHALDLASSTSSEGERRQVAGDAGPILDATAKAQYHARLVELDEELREAEQRDDRERMARADEERAQLLEQLAFAVGLGGRDRKAASNAERARVSVTRAIRRVLDRIADRSPALGAHLTATIRTGQYCAYTPDPRSPIRWEL